MCDLRSTWRPPIAECLEAFATPLYPLMRTHTSSILYRGRFLLKRNRGRSTTKKCPGLVCGQPGRLVAVLDLEVLSAANERMKTLYHYVAFFSTLKNLHTAPIASNFRKRTCIEAFCWRCIGNGLNACKQKPGNGSLSIQAPWHGESRVGTRGGFGDRLLKLRSRA